MEKNEASEWDTESNFPSTKYTSPTSTLCLRSASDDFPMLAEACLVSCTSVLFPEWVRKMPILSGEDSSCLMPKSRFFGVYFEMDGKMRFCTPFYTRELGTSKTESAAALRSSGSESALETTTTNVASTFLTEMVSPEHHLTMTISVLLHLPRQRMYW